MAGISSLNLLYMLKYKSEPESGAQKTSYTRVYTVYTGSRELSRKKIKRRITGWTCKPLDRTTTSDQSTREVIIEPATHYWWSPTLQEVAVWISHHSQPKMCLYQNQMFFRLNSISQKIATCVLYTLLYVTNSSSVRNSFSLIARCHL